MKGIITSFLILASIGVVAQDDGQVQKIPNRKKKIFFVSCFEPKSGVNSYFKDIPIYIIQDSLLAQKLGTLNCAFEACVPKEICSMCEHKEVMKNHDKADFFLHGDVITDDRRGKSYLRIRILFDGGHYGISDKDIPYVSVRSETSPKDCAKMIVIAMGQHFDQFKTIIEKQK